MAESEISMAPDRDAWPPARTQRLRAHHGLPRRSPRRIDKTARAGSANTARTSRILTLVALLALCALAPPLAAEPPRNGSVVGSRDAELFESLARHPASARRAALMMAGEPEALLEIDRIQQNSARRFADLLMPYSRRERQQIWNLVRYPGLVAALARDGRKSRAQLEAIADRFPPEERDAILEAGAERYALWVEIYGLDLETRQRARRALPSADPQLQAAFDALEDRPELMSLLLENIRWTTRLGSEYRDDPTGVAQRFATLEPEIEARRRQDETAWAEELDNPASAEELDRAAQAFAEAFGLEPERSARGQDEVGDQANSPEYAAQVTLEDGGRRSRTLRNTARAQQAYPYWFGYPDWYAAPLWIPLGLADHVGFRRGHGTRPRRRFVPVGLPSRFFLSWYYDVYRAADRANSGHRIRYYDERRPRRARRARPRTPSAGIMREAETPRVRKAGGDQADRGRRTSTSGDSSGRGAGRGSRADATTLPPDGRTAPNRAR